MLTNSFPDSQTNSLTNLLLPQSSDDRSIFNSDFLRFGPSRTHLFLKRCFKLILTLGSGALLCYFLITPLLARRVQNEVVSDLDSQISPLSKKITDMACSEVHRTIGLNVTYCEQNIAGFVANMTSLVQSDLKHDINAEYDKIKTYLFLLTFIAFTSGVVGGYATDKAVSFCGNLYSRCRLQRNSELRSLNPAPFSYQSTNALASNANQIPAENIPLILNATSGS